MISANNNFLKGNNIYFRLGRVTNAESNAIIHIHKYAVRLRSFLDLSDQLLVLTGTRAIKMLM